MALSWRLIHADDFTTYTSDADVEAAYAPDPPDHYGDTATDWGATYGPDGQPGIKNQVVAPTVDTGVILKGGLNPSCRGFRVKGRFDFANTGGVLTAHGFCYIAHETDGSTIVQIARVHAPSTLRVLIVSDPTPLVTIDVAGVLPNAPTDFELQGERSTITETSPGVFAPETDGWVKVYINGVEQASFTGAVWNGDDSVNPTPYWNFNRIQTIGAFTNWEIYDDVSCVVSPPCECVPPPTTPPRLPPPIPKNPPKVEPTIGEQLACLGGGLVPQQADLVYVENWWGL